jgi:hypothetical protein
MLRDTPNTIFHLHCHTRHNLYLGSHALRYALKVGSATSSCTLTMVKTRWMPNDDAIIIPAQPRRGQGKSNTPSTDAKGELIIATPPPPLQQGQQSTTSTDAAKQEANKCHEKSHHIASNILCICLRCRIAKIKQMCTDVVERYGKFYGQRYGKPLPQDVINQIQLLYHHCIKLRCAKLQLTVEAEEEWNPDNAFIDELGLLDSGEESQEHDSDDITFYKDSIDDVDKEEGVTKH